MPPSLPCFLLDRIKVVTYLTYVYWIHFQGHFRFSALTQSNGAWSDVRRHYFDY